MTRRAASGCRFILVRFAPPGPYRVLFVMAGASRGQGDTLLNLFYPDHDAFWLGLLPGVPAVLALCSGRRHVIPRLWRALRWLLILAQIALLFWQPVLWWLGEPLSGIGIALVVADIVALMWLLTNPAYAPVLRKSQISAALLPMPHSNKR